MFDSDLIVGELVPGLFPVGEDLPQHHAEAPNVALCGEPPVHDALWWHPADWQHCMTAHLQRRVFISYQSFLKGTVYPKIKKNIGYLLLFSTIC